MPFCPIVIVLHAPVWDRDLPFDLKSIFFNKYKIHCSVSCLSLSDVGLVFIKACLCLHCNEQFSSKRYKKQRLMNYVTSYPKIK